MSPTAVQVVVSLLTGHSHTFVVIDHRIISMVILLLQLIQEGLQSKVCAQSTGNGLVNLAKINVWLGELTIST